MAHRLQCAIAHGDDPNYEGITVTATVTPPQYRCTSWDHGLCKNQPSLPPYQRFQSNTCVFEVAPGNEGHPEFGFYHLENCGGYGSKYPGGFPGGSW